MPRIPKFQQTTSIPGSTGGVAMSPQLASAPERALIGLGQSVSQVGQEFDKIAEKEALANDTIKATKMETDLRNKEREIADRLNGETNYENYQKIVDDGVKELQALVPKDASQRLSNAFLKASADTEASLRDVAQKKKWQSMDEQGRVAFIDLKNQAKEDWIKAETDDERDLIAGNLQLKAMALKQNLAVDGLWLKGQTETFDKEVKSEGQIRGRTIAYEASKVDPVGTATRLRDDKTYLSYLEPDTRLALQKELDTAARSFVNAEGASAEIVKLKREATIKYPNDPERALSEALRMAEDPDYQEKLNNDIVHARIITSLSNAYSQNEKLYKVEADDNKGQLMVDILDDKITQNDLTDNDLWKSLRPTDRAIISNFANSKHRADVQSVREGKSLKLAEQQAKKYEQNEEATIFFGKTLTKIADGSYTDANQIIKDFTVDNPVIRSKVNSYVSLFKSIEAAPELKFGIQAIKQAATRGLLDPSDPKNNLYKQGNLTTELRNKYMTEDDFRGEKINSWLQQKLNPEVKNGIGVWLNNLFKSTPKEPSAPAVNTPSQADLEFTAKKHGITIEEVRKRLGMNDAT
jgi:hypothetical protein